jgi:hypothetical protein
MAFLKICSYVLAAKERKERKDFFLLCVLCVLLRLLRHFEIWRQAGACPTTRPATAGAARGQMARQS